MRRITEIEGFRAYLALWVVCSHVISHSQFAIGEVHRSLLVLLNGPLAVDVFIMISGFVIFYLLDHRKESYAVFITRRFFRLWPLFIFLFLLGIIQFTVKYNTMDMAEFSRYVQGLEAGQVAFDRFFFEREMSQWHNMGTHTFLHATLLHGTVPGRLLHNAPGAFLYPGWSVSLEWQFYIVAPFFFWAVVRWGRTRAVQLVLVLLAVFTVGQFWPHTRWGAALPINVGYFYIGCFSYFLYKRLAGQEGQVLLWPYAALLAIMLGVVFRSQSAIPFLIWAPFFCLIVDRARMKDRRSTLWVSFVFNNPVTQYLGKISYSIYLSHVFAIVVAISSLEWLGLAQDTSAGYFLAVLVLTVLYTVIFSTGLYYVIEVRGIKIGNELAKKISPPKKESEESGSGATPTPAR